MARVRLERRAPRGPAGRAQRPGGGADLDRIAERRARAVRLQRYGSSRRPGDRHQEPLLRRPVRCRERRARAVLLHGDPVDARAPGSCRHLERSAALAAAVAVGVEVERVAAAALAEHARGAERRRDARGDERDARRDGARALAEAQRAHGGVRRDERGRARRVEGRAGPREAERVRHAAGRDRQRVGRPAVDRERRTRLGFAATRCQQARAGDTEEEADRRGSQSLPRRVQSRVRALQDETALRIHDPSFRGRDRECARVALDCARERTVAADSLGPSRSSDERGGVRGQRESGQLLQS
mmetsp:Transcript_12662/g.43170  ORF Transcript_12662/g.43170 Transcript_12662/m.43170 type:complete len:300 (-) Transcript_12662:6646-7545(-)